MDKAIKELERFEKKAVPYAIREYANNAAFAARGEYIKRSEANMKLRSAWTTKSIQVEKARVSRGQSVQSRMGSVADYMATQERGATVRGQGKHGTAIPAAAPGRRRGRGRTAAKNRLSAIQLQGTRVGGIRQRRNAVALSMALKRGGGVVYLDLRKNRGLYRVSGTRRGARIRKVWDLSKRSVRVPENPMMAQAMKAVEPQLERIARKALAYQFKRHGIPWAVRALAGY